MLSRLHTNISLQVLLRSTVSAKKLAVSRHIHFVRVTQNLSTRGRHVIDLHKYPSVLGVLSVRHSSTVNNTPGSQGTVDSSAASLESLKLEEINVTSEAATASSPTDLFEYIPDPPTLPIDKVLEVVAELHANGEPTFQSLGLSGWSPFGLLLNSLEWLHITCGLPWWGTVLVMTVFLKAVTFPLMVKQRAYFVNMQNNKPELAKLEKKLSVAKRCGDKLSTCVCHHDIQNFKTEKNLSPLKMGLIAVLQAQVQLVMFVSLNRMAAIPVDSLRHEGLWWFTDLSLSDPFYILPLATCGSIALSLIKSEGFLNMTSIQPKGFTRIIYPLLPFAIFPIIMNLPAILTWYFCTSSIMMAMITPLIGIPRVKKFLKIPESVQHDSKALQNQGFFELMKEYWEDIQMTKEVENRERILYEKFLSAGKSGIQKTYKYDPTKKAQSTVLTKKRGYN